MTAPQRPKPPRSAREPKPPEPRKATTRARFAAELEAKKAPDDIPLPDADDSSLRTILR